MSIVVSGVPQEVVVRGSVGDDGDASTFLREYEKVIEEGADATTVVLRLLDLRKWNDQARPVIARVFGNEKFVESLFKLDNIVVVLKRVFMEDAEETSRVIFQEIVTAAMKTKAAHCLKLNDIIMFLRENEDKLCESGKVDLAFLMALASSSNTQDKDVFVIKENFQFLAALLSHASPDQIVQCFSILVMNAAQCDFRVLPNIFTFYVNRKDAQLTIFNWVCGMLVEQKEFIEKIDFAFPLCQWMIGAIPVRLQAAFIDGVTEVSEETGKRMFATLLSLLSETEYTVDDYLCCIDLIDRHLRARTLSLSFLVDANFLHSLVLAPPVELVEELLLKSSVFGQIVYEVYSCEGKQTYQSEVFPILLKVCAKNPNISYCLSPFLVNSPTKENVKMVMDGVLEYKNSQLLKALSTSLSRCRVAANFFLELNGLDWLEQILPSIITIDDYSDVLVSLSTKVDYREINAHIFGLDPGHPIFHVSESTAKRLVFGRHEMENPPILIPALVPILTNPVELDPYNAYVIGKYVLEKCRNWVLAGSYLKTIACRYLSDAAFSYLWDNCGCKTLEGFCDDTSDNFPLLLLRPSTEGIEFKCPFKCISFWFKLPELIHPDVKVRLFTADGFGITLNQAKVLTISYNGMSHHVRINPLTWNHVLIKFSSARISGLVKVFINKAISVLRGPAEVERFESFSFNMVCCYLAIGSAIRISNAGKCKSVPELYSRGPSFMEYSNPMWEEKIVTPFAVNQKHGVSYPVRYRGFPMHFLTEEKANLLFMRIAQSENHPHFEAACSLSFRLFRILGRRLKNYYEKMLDAFIEVPQFLTKDIVLELMKTASRHVSKADLLNETLIHRRAWEKIDNDLLIYGLFNLFERCDFGKDQKLVETFLVSRLFLHPESTYITKCIMISRQWLPEATELLISLLLSGSLVENELKSHKVQQTIVQCLKELSSLPGHVDDVISLIPFKTLKSLFVTCDVELQVPVFELMALIEGYTSYISLDTDFLLALARTVHSPQVWNAALLLVSKDKKILNECELTPVLLALIFGASLSIFHSVWMTGVSVPAIEDQMNVGLALLKTDLKSVLECETFVDFFKSWFPFVVNPTSRMAPSGFLEKILHEMHLPDTATSDHSEAFRHFAATSSFTDFLACLAKVADIPVLSIITMTQNITSRKFQIFFSELAHVWVATVSSHVRQVHLEFFTVLCQLAISGYFIPSLRLLDDVLVFTSLLESQYQKLFKKAHNIINDATFRVIKMVHQNEVPVMFHVLVQYMPVFVKIVGDKQRAYMQMLAQRAIIDEESFRVFAEGFVAAAEIKMDQKDIQSFLAHDASDITLTNDEQRFMASPRKEIVRPEINETSAFDSDEFLSDIKTRAQTIQSCFRNCMELISRRERVERIQRNGEEFLIPARFGFSKRVVVPRWIDTGLDLRGDGVVPVESKPGRLKLGDLVVDVFVASDEMKLTIVPKEYPKALVDYFSRGYWKWMEIREHGVVITVYYSEIDEIADVDVSTYIISGSTFRPFVLESASLNLTQFVRRKLPLNIDNFWKIEGKIENVNWKEFESQWLSHRIQWKCEHSVAFGNKFLIATPAKLSFQLSNNEDLFLFIDKGVMQMRVEDKEHRVLFQDCDAFYGIAKRITSSWSKNHFVIDFGNYVTKVYKVIHEEKPTFVLIQRHQFSKRQITSINEIDAVCVTSQGSELVLWDYVNNREIRRVTVGAEVDGLEVDEERGVIWVCSDAEVILYSMNGDRLFEHKTQSRITAMACGPGLGCFIGCSDRTVKIVSMRGCVNVESPFDAVIRSIFLHVSMEGFAAVDKYGNAAVWIAKGAHLSLPRDSLEEIGD